MILKFIKLFTIISKQSFARNQYGDIVVTLSNKKRKDALLAIGYVELQGEKFEVLDPVDPITNVVVLGVP